MGKNISPASPISSSSSYLLWSAWAGESVERKLPVWVRVDASLAQELGWALRERV